MLAVKLTHSWAKAERWRSSNFAAKAWAPNRRAEAPSSIYFYFSLISPTANEESSILRLRKYPRAVTSFLSFGWPPMFRNLRVGNEAVRVIGPLTRVISNENICRCHWRRRYWKVFTPHLRMLIKQLEERPIVILFFLWPNTKKVTKNEKYVLPFLFRLNRGVFVTTDE